MANKTCICIICGKPIFYDELRVMVKPPKGRAYYAHRDCTFVGRWVKYGEERK